VDLFVAGMSAAVRRKEELETQKGN
jgi:hypothetical protein